jgi:AcrR family transcriptional regulator
MGLREKKKLKTRKHISDVARELFISKGYAAVTVAEIAEKSEVAVTTLFNYFPKKESIIFDREDEIDSEIRAAVGNRKKGESCLEALHRYFYSSGLIDPQNKRIHSDFMKLIRSSPELTLYFRGIWSRYELTVAKEIQSATRAHQLEAECMAKLILEAVNFACHAPKPKVALNLAFEFLKDGFNP